ncbi:MAG TPA: HlyD family efflux transporter periplasmic adaptor subunit [Pirellulales bacterium]|nr:HlyD family efflux transporter periplasmic adaptor subunit [Pirellulales bacterium]
MAGLFSKPRWMWVIGALLVCGAVAWVFIPRPVSVEVAPVKRGLLQISIDATGQSRVKQRTLISAPVSGRLERIELVAGDPVEAGKTLIARIEPGEPALIDARVRTQIEAKTNVAEVNLKRAGSSWEAARAAHDFAAAELRRARLLREQDADLISKEDLEKAELLERTRAEELNAAAYSRQIAQYELTAAQAQLAESPDQTPPRLESLDVRSPVSGRVLRVLHESAGPVAAGTPLAEVGDPRDLEFVVEVLSRDAVRIRPQAEVLIENWGGDADLRGVVSRVYPSAFTRVSALGVSEQRVTVIVGLADPKPKRPLLGDGFQVDARIVVWQGASVLKVPTSALFRHGQTWCVLRVENGRAAQSGIKLGQMGQREAEVLSGLAEHDLVIVHPGDQVTSGTRVVAASDAD